MLDKRFKIFVYVLLLAHFAVAQSGFNKYYPSGSVSTSNRIISINQAKFLLTSYYKDSATSTQGIDLKHIDYDGNVLIRKRYLFNNLDFGIMLYNPDFQNDISNSTMLLTTSTYSGSTSTVIFGSFNKSTLDTNWVKYFSDGVYNYYFNSFFKTKPNEFWLFGQRSNSMTSNRPTALKVDSFGNVLSIKEFTALTKHFPQASYYDVDQNLIYLTGNNSSNSSDHKTYVACMDTTGNVLWNTVFSNIPFKPDFFRIRSKNNYVIVCGANGEFEYGGFVYNKLNIVKINSSNGSILWNKKYHSACFSNYLRDFIINDDESIVATGATCLYSPTVEYNNDGVILKVNSIGDSLWMQTYSNYGQGTWEGFLNLTKASDQGMIFCGKTTNPSNNHSWVVKTDSLGIASGISTAVIDKEQSNDVIAVYPNPVNDALSIQLKAEGLLGKVLTIKLYNSMMQLVLEKEVEMAGGKIHLNTSEFNNGLYILQLEGKRGTISRKLIIEH